MGQRSKVLDTEGPTPKFLYAIIKQLDIRSVNWNRVASDLEISNGHAARMRYSRFKSQMEPSSAQKPPRKKNIKKGENGGCKGNMPASAPLPMSMQMPFPMPALGSALKMEPSDSQFPSSTSIKCESGRQTNAGDSAFAEISEFQHHFQRMISSNGMPYPSHMSHYVPRGLQYSMTSGVPPPLPHYEHSFPSMALPNDVNMHNFSLQQPAFYNAPVITWEPPAPIQRDPTPAKIKEEPEVVQSMAFHDAPIKMENLRKDRLKDGADERLPSCNSLALEIAL
ncbi:hypothetical protein N7448_007147 [Penicillium atrosanguineum]|uniref:Myb-like DNA-binding domain-containing protein n=1 Tax=Penicillium atrosanguineum TaxID=1132637 RepID=A0A9W9U393_9EURO|nr:uncharacterized protein N7443_010910 [Penicillium atrosanguineum]KAJ5132989.1 hypothetical protein N7448_007147 [Penicillium atrosanguineum]KAJ5141118.1 hypothetical protein N7526_002113 [Penicillium atrosanguineum]KAJ5290657.1 hypothetical protein N7443_010910 [Penicillium atrosanguineum]KAJ5308480.1 hypothetical protein N7476_009136 [Penicillium atrosanguineum]